MASITVSDLQKVFPGSPPVSALADITLSVRDGEFVSVLGPSGCGKSTLLEIIAGLQPPSGGQVALGGRPVGGARPDVGVVFQDPSLFPWRSVAGNVEFGLEVQGVSRVERRHAAQRYIDLVKLTGFEGAYPRQLSGGMRQRAGLARTLATGPDILLMDEPFGAVDHLTRLQLQGDLLEIWERECKTVVFVTHDVAEAVFLGDRVVLLSPHPGRIQRIFPVELARPRRRNHPVFLSLLDAIYREIYAVQGEGEIEYTI